MAEVLTLDNAPEQVSADNLTTEEQDSLKLGEEIQAEEDSLLAGKYKDAKDLETAYIELQKKLGTQEDKPEEEATETTDEAETPEEEKKEDAPADTAFLDTLWEEAQKESWSDEVVDQLRKTDPVDLANQYLQFRKGVVENETQDLSEEQAKGLKDVVGGEEAYSNMIEWANQTLDSREIDMFDQVMDKGDPLACYFAVRSLAYRYEDTAGRQGDMITGTAPKTQGSTFRSQQEMVAAMSDPRYENDPGYRQDIVEKLARSDLNF